MNEILVPISPGELLDKITILEIKSERIDDPEKVSNVRHELGLLSQVWSDSVSEDETISILHQLLKSINEELWEIEADIVLSPDSGPTHLANALGTPVIGLYACSWSKRSGPYNSLDLCVDKFSEAAQQFRGKEPQELRWGTRIERAGVMDLIQVDEVIEKLEQAARGLGQE